MPDTEVEISGGFGLPELAGFKAHIEARFKRTWSDRGRDLVEKTSALAGVTPDSLKELVASSEQRSDLFGSMLVRSVEVADPLYREVLARLLAASLDTAAIDTAQYLGALVVRIDPVELRQFMGFVEFYRKGDDGYFVPTDIEHAETWESIDRIFGARTFIPKREPYNNTDDSHDKDVALRLASFRALEAIGFLSQGEEPDEEGPHVYWTIGMTGTVLLRLMFPGLPLNARFHPDAVERRRNRKRRKSARETSSKGRTRTSGQDED
jgi:hypothetical protein